MDESAPTAASRPPSEPRGPPDVFERVLDILPRVLLGMTGVFFFVLGIELMKVIAGLIGPVLEGFVGRFAATPWHSLSFGWLSAYAVLSGSPVAAMALGFYATGYIGPEETFFMIMGSRLGAAFIVLVLGAVAVLRGTPREKALAMGVLCFLVTYSIYLPAILLGWVLVRLRAYEWFQIPTPTALLDLINWVFGPIVAWVVDALRIAPLLGFLLAAVAIYAGLALFDKAFGQREVRELKSPRMHHYLRHPGVALAVGALVTLASTSVSLSFGLLVPLYLNGYIDRKEILPYMMGANITTFIDTLVAGFLYGGGVAANIVLIEMASVTLFSLIALAGYGPYARAIEAAYSAVFHSNAALVLFIVLLFAVPTVLLFLF
jgi:solute carrier family 34 (sodium-dependent phosphate cotransporter)